MNTNPYSDIIHLPRHVSTKHPPLTADQRSAQFAPYAALVGHKDIIAEDENIASSQTDLDTKIEVIPVDES